MKETETAFKNAKERMFSETMRPIINYLREARKQADLTGTQIHDKMEKFTGKRYGFERHAFNFSQFEFPTRDTYHAAQTFIPTLKTPYEELNAQYIELKKTFNLQYPRRYHAPQKKNYTDVFEYMPIIKAKERFHSCHTPPHHDQDMITTSCPPDGTVLDPFAGSGETGIFALTHWHLSHRQFVKINYARITLGHCNAQQDYLSHL